MLFTNIHINYDNIVTWAVAKIKAHLDAINGINSYFAAVAVYTVPNPGDQIGRVPHGSAALAGRTGSF